MTSAPIFEFSFSCKLSIFYLKALPIEVLTILAEFSNFESFISFAFFATKFFNALLKTLSF